MMAFDEIKLGYEETECLRLSLSGGVWISDFKIYPRILFLEALFKDLSETVKNLTLNLQG